ncbi:unnamed protein product [marine sediment metagenome]|uniref:HTH cro/C1-type domain-containing protein n=1 Tax=marine sediment metagenome TaxID=412755 RepID=X1D8Z7_9ZZZZ
MSNKYGNKIGINLKKFRKQKNYSLEKVSKLSGLSLNTVVKIESNINKNPTIETLNKIAKALEIGVDKLIK